MTAPWWQGSVGGAGRDQSVKGESCAAASLSSIRRWAVLIQATRARTSCVLQWQAVGFVQTNRLRLREGERRNLPPNCLTPGTREVESLQTSHQQSLHCIWKGERGKVNIRYAWQITWRVGGEVNVYRPEAYCINVCTSLYADKMAEGSIKDGKKKQKHNICLHLLSTRERESSDSNYALIRHFIKKPQKNQHPFFITHSLFSSPHVYLHDRSVMSPVWSESSGLLLQQIPFSVNIQELTHILRATYSQVASRKKNRTQPSRLK